MFKKYLMPDKTMEIRVLTPKPEKVKNLTCDINDDAILMIITSSRTA